ncbi:methyltransferase domain-containing protein [Saccharospirillum impatiens]|uniref:methyltransferase domain-containing protein n=1 Tax=Saccharospirillum impatiens TaxID=169438 RepID=UPI0004239B15|nr:methyltransferase domain-containing protein [Saccharospirillum impatiens]
MEYVNFDPLAERFSKNIYGSLKGRIRQTLLETLYPKYMPELRQPDLSVLDAGGGLGQMTQWLLGMGHRVEYFDVAGDLVAQVEQDVAESIASGQCRVSQASVFDFESAPDRDLVIVHAVLEWLERPQAALDRAMNWVAPGGVIGVMVYNRHMLELRNLMRGTLEKVKTGQLQGLAGGLTPITPLSPEPVRQQLVDAGFEILTQAGIRTFSDLTEPTVLSWYSDDDIIEMEQRLCEQAPYRDLGRYVLLLARKTAIAA